MSFRFWQVIAAIEIRARYDGYLRRQHEEVERARHYAALSLPSDLDYARVAGLSHEVRQKLAAVRPLTVGQASRVQGVTPAAVSMLLVHLKKRGRGGH